MPTAASRSYAPSVWNLSSISLTWCSISFGPLRMSETIVAAATGSNRPSVISTSIDDAPRSTAAKRRVGFSSTRVERRPPRLAAGPAS
jgi:hypothetical protein